MIPIFPFAIILPTCRQRREHYRGKNSYEVPVTFPDRMPQKPAHPAGWEAGLFSMFFGSPNRWELFNSLPDLDTREVAVGTAVKPSVPNPHASLPESPWVAGLFWWPFLVLTDLGALFIDVVCGLGTSGKACHELGSGLGELLSNNPCWSSQTGPSIFSLCWD